MTNDTHKSSSKRSYIPRILRCLAWCGMILSWYLIIVIFFDMPSEHKLRHSTDNLQSEYDELSSRYDELSAVLSNVEERDINVSRKLFESNPYDLGASNMRNQSALYEEVIGLSNEMMMVKLNQKIEEATHTLNRFKRSYETLRESIDSDSTSRSNIPAIQPINNKQLTLLAAGKKPLINPFHRIEREHHGVDYLVPEGTPIFATADGTIESLTDQISSRGKVVMIDHGNGYKTSYGHLSEIRVKRGDKVKRGDIIALSGNSGLSFAPHLHYEVVFNGTRVDPVHYFFMELTPEEYKSIKQIALSSMQSFD